MPFSAFPLPLCCCKYACPQHSVHCTSMWRLSHINTIVSILHIKVDLAGFTSVVNWLYVTKPSLIRCALDDDHLTLFRVVGNMNIPSTDWKMWTQIVYYNKWTIFRTLWAQDHFSHNTGSGEGDSLGRGSYNVVVAIDMCVWFLIISHEIWLYFSLHYSVVLCIL